MELYFETREEWRDWLSRYYESSKGIWLIYYKKKSGKKRIPYNDALEEALCFGWIDGKIKRINDDYYIQWFSPRRRGSRWSARNIQKVRNLIGLGKMEAPGLIAFREVLERPELAYDMHSAPDTGIPDDLMKEFNLNEKARGNFESFSPSARRLYLLWLNDAKRPETRRKRILAIIERSEKNIKPGMM